MIDLMPDDEDQQLIDTASSLLTQSMGHDTLRAMVDEGRHADTDLLRRFGELGWYAMTLDEAQGGAELSIAQEALVFREIGRHLVPGPVLSTTLAALVAADAGDTDLAQKLATGERLAGLAETAGGERWTVWDTTDVNLVVAVDLPAHRVWMLDVDQVPSGEPFASIDPLISMAWAPATEMAASEANAVCRAPDARRAISHGLVLCSAMLAGIAEHTRDEGAEYVKQRVQFGRPIGSFQAVKHRCADTAVRAEAAWSQTLVAAFRLTQAPPAAFDVASAKVVAGDAAVRNCRDNIQNHGGIGFTAEHEAHLYLKRAHVLEQTLGGTRHHLRTTRDAAIGW